MSEIDKLCLGHSHEGKPNGCKSANNCQLHTGIRRREFDETVPVHGRICGEHPAPACRIDGERYSEQVIKEWK